MEKILRDEILKTVSESNLTELELITSMQGHCVAIDDMKTLDLLIKIKNEYI